MAISYPLSMPTPTIGMESIVLRSVNVVATSQSPFTLKQQVVAHQGQRWEASVNIPPVKRDKAAKWTAFLTALKGQRGTFLLGDPDYSTPQGTISTGTITGSAGDETVTVSMTGTLLAGDYIQLGALGAARLHKVLEDQSGNGNLEIWPALRNDYTAQTILFNNPRGVFRLANNINEWSINNSSVYGMSFDCIEVIS